ncbi:hypothetical protein B0H19DRAFT_1015368 [Mycena capillaripes]|nr:hypothetical protein B0H19DRAFT_1015368 [Mycena capillaripes]
MAPYYGPLGETPEQILLERTFMQAGYLTGVGYGLQLALYLACMRILWRRYQIEVGKRRATAFLMAFISVLAALDTMYTGVSTYGLQTTFIDNRNYPAPDADSPGGPIAYLNVEFALGYNIISQVVFTLGNLMADALLIWRCRAIWNVRFRELVMLFPYIMWVGSLGMGIMFGIQTARAGLFTTVTASFAVPYFTISLSLNIILTLLIVGKIAYHQRSMTAILGPGHRSSGLYAMVTSMFIESAALYAIDSILLLVTFGLGHPINQIWLGLSPSIQKISSYLIIYRVAQGQDWNSTVKTANTTTTTRSGAISFNSVPTGSSHTRATERSEHSFPLHSFVKPEKTIELAPETFTQSNAEDLKYD